VLVEDGPLVDIGQVILVERGEQDALQELEGRDKKKNARSDGADRERKPKLQFLPDEKIENAQNRDDLDYSDYGIDPSFRSTSPSASANPR